LTDRGSGSVRRIALYSDVHGNLAALESVLEDIEGRGVSERYCLGDLVGYGPHPVEVVERIRDLGDPVAQGNYDRAISEHDASPGSRYESARETLDGAESYAYTVSSLSSEHVDFLGRLAAEVVLDVDGVGILLCHGSPRRMVEVVDADTPPASLAAHIQEAGVDVVCCGHVHVPFHRSMPTESSVLHWVNAGSVGRPRDGDPRAAWVKLVLGTHEEVLAAAPMDIACRRAGCTDVWISTITHRVAYDVEPVIHDMIAAGLPPTLAAGLRSGLEEHAWEALMAERAAHDAEETASQDPVRAEYLLQTCGHDGGSCTCAIDDRTASYESLARLFRDDVPGVVVAIRHLRTAMRSCRVSRNVDEQAIREAFGDADRAVRTAEGRRAFLEERRRLFGGESRFDPFSNVLSPDESTYVSADPDTCLVVLGLTYREGRFTSPVIGGIERGLGDIATELSYMGHCLRMAAAGDPAAAVRARRFFIEHLSTWAVLFAVVVAREARDPVMRYAGLALDKFLTCEAATFRHSVPSHCGARSRGLRD